MFNTANKLTMEELTKQKNSDQDFVFDTRAYLNGIQEWKLLLNEQIKYGFYCDVFTSLFFYVDCTNKADIHKALRRNCSIS